MRIDDGDSCYLRGGTWKRVCLAQRLYCVMPTRDAGKPCTDSKQCERGCVYTGPSPGVGDAVVGECRRDAGPCGCWSFVSNGKLRGGLCVD